MATTMHTCLLLFFFKFYAQSLQFCCRSYVYTDKPTAPIDLRVVDRHKDYVSMAWKAPTSDGGALITGYVIERREGSRTKWTKVGETSSETLKYKATRLTEGSEYAFRVAAENSIGVGEFATIDKPVKADVSFGQSKSTYRFVANPFNSNCSKLLCVRRVQRHTGLAHYF